MILADIQAVAKIDFIGKEKETKIAMQLSISKYSDVQGYVFISLCLKLFAFPQIIKKSTTNKTDFPQGSTETASAYLTTHFSVGKTTFWLIKNYTFYYNVCK